MARWSGQRRRTSQSKRHRASSAALPPPSVRGLFASRKNILKNDLTNAIKHAIVSRMNRMRLPSVPAGADLMAPSLALVQQTATPVHNLRGGGADCLIRGRPCAGRSHVGRVEGWLPSFLPVGRLVSACLSSRSSAWVLSLLGGFGCFARFALSDLVVSSRPSLLGSLAIARGIQEDGDGQVVSANPIYPFVERS